MSGIVPVCHWDLREGKNVVYNLLICQCTPLSEHKYYAENILLPCSLVFASEDGLS